MKHVRPAIYHAIEIVAASGFEHYGYNFCQARALLRPTNYWKNIPYLGIGPSAHSFNGLSRQWNISNNAKYMESRAGGISLPKLKS